MLKDATDIPLEQASFSIIDIETTGLSARYNNIIEIGIVKISNLKIVDTFHSMINPGRAIPYYITQFTGISDDDVYNAPFFEDAADDILKFISEDIIGGHNFSFDKSFLKRELLYAGKGILYNDDICTLKLARRMHPNLRSRSLSKMCRLYKLHNEYSHRALSDAKVTAQLLIRMIEDLRDNLGINTVNELLHFHKQSTVKEKSSRIKESLREDISILPQAPGIYYFLNSKNDIIYIGKAKSLKDRIKSYFSPTAPRKAKKIVGQAARIKIEITNTGLTALLMEAESIKIVNPRHNKQLKEYGNKYFLRIDCIHSYPGIDICNYFDFDGRDYFGLFLTKKKAAALLEMLHKTFALRECSDVEFIKEKICFLADIERCLAPCVAKNHEEYTTELDKVYDFLYGKNQYALTRLLHKMKEYSEKQKYEKAAEVKEVIDLILNQTFKSSVLAEPVNKANVLFEIRGNFENDYMLLLSGKIYIKKYKVNGEDHFEEALDDYYSGTINLSLLPCEEDLEKMKITLNWLVKNRNNVRVFYLKEYRSKEELYGRISTGKFTPPPPQEVYYDIKEFLNQNGNEQKIEEGSI
ncbi:MAG TPA: exonuclease domain-containing protein [Ignavibacteriaceae bacterium]|nr:exonuclease domain-containing protein [Ignavibacteriaceae bacterium]